MTYYRVQPQKKSLPTHSTSSRGEKILGCFVFKSLKELYTALKYWPNNYFSPKENEIVKIKSRIKVYDPGDIEGYILNDPKALIIKRLSIDLHKVYKNYPILDK